MYVFDYMWVGGWVAAGCLFLAHLVTDPGIHRILIVLWWFTAGAERLDAEMWRRKAMRREGSR